MSFKKDPTIELIIGNEDFSFMQEKIYGHNVSICFDNYYSLDEFFSELKRQARAHEMICLELSSTGNLEFDANTINHVKYSKDFAKKNIDAFLQAYNLPKIFELFVDKENIYTSNLNKFEMCFFSSLFILIDERVTHKSSAKEYLRVINEKYDAEMQITVFVLGLKSNMTQANFIGNSHKVDIDISKYFDAKKLTSVNYSKKDEYEKLFILYCLLSMKLEDHILAKCILKFSNYNEIFLLYNEYNRKEKDNEKDNEQKGTVPEYVALEGITRLWSSQYSTEINKEVSPFITNTIHEMVNEYDPMNYKIYDLLSKFSYVDNKELDNRIMEINAINAIRNRELISISSDNYALRAFSKMQKIRGNTIRDPREIQELYEDFLIGVSKNHKIFLIFLGSYLHSELGNASLYDEQYEVKLRLKILFEGGFAPETQEFVKYCKDIFDMKDTTSSSSHEYEDKVKVIIDQYNAFRTTPGVENDMINFDILYFYISNWLGINLYNIDFDSEKYEKALLENEFESEETNAKLEKKYYKIRNNLCVLQSRKAPIDAVQAFENKIMISKVNHPIIYNNYIGLILANPRGLVQEEKISKLFKDYKDSITIRSEEDFYSFFFNINLLIAITITDFDSLKSIAPLSSMEISKLYEHTKEENFFSLCLDYYNTCLNNGDNFKIEVMTQKSKDIMDYDYPYSYLFIDYQEWSFI